MGVAGVDKTAGVPMELLLSLIKGHKVKYFIETGTSEGYSILEASRVFDMCHTIELQEGRLSDFVVERLSEQKKQVNFYYGDSVGHLPRILKSIPAEEYVVFWLDAHYCGSEPAPEGMIECPIIQEITEIRKCQKAIILIDDARLFMGVPPHPHNPKNWPAFQYVFSTLKSTHPTNMVTVVDDYIISFPQELKENFDSYWIDTFHERYIQPKQVQLPELLKQTVSFYINLEKDVTRNERMQSLLKRFGIEAHRIEGKIADKRSITEPFTRMAERNMNAVGCYLSHAYALMLGRTKDAAKNIFIMEDDLVFCDDFHERINYAENFLKEKEWDIFWLGGTYHLNPPVWHDEKHTHPDLPDCTCKLGRDVELTEDPRIVRTYGIWSTYAYIINKDSAKKIYQMLNECLEKSYSIDHAFIMLQPRLKTYAFVPALVKQYDSMSNIQGGIMNFSSFANLGKQWFAYKMDDVDPSSIDWKEARV